MTNKLLTFRIDRSANYLSRLTKIILTFSSTTLLLSTILYVIYRQKCWTHDSLPGTIVWYSIFVGLSAIFFGLISIIILSIYYRRKQQTIWLVIKKEIVLLILTIGLLLILALTINIINQQTRERNATVGRLRPANTKQATTFCVLTLKCVTWI